MHSPLMSNQMTYAQSPLHNNQTIINSPMSAAAITPIGQQHSSYSNVNSPLASSNSNVMYSNSSSYGQQTYSNVAHGNYAMSQSFETRTNGKLLALKLFWHYIIMCVRTRDENYELKQILYLLI